MHMGDIVDYKLWNNTLYVLSNMGICRLRLEVGLTDTERVHWCLGNYQVLQAYPSISNIQITTDGIVLFMLKSNLYAIDSWSGEARWAKSGFVDVPAASYNCLFGTYDPSHSILFMSCAEKVLGIDVSFALRGNLVFSTGVSNQMNVDFYADTVYLSPAPQEYAYDDVGVSGFHLPRFLTNRSGPVIPVATSPPESFTAAPGFSPLPTPIPTALPYAPFTSDNLAPVSYPVSANTAGNFFSNAFNPEIDSNIVFYTPHYKSAIPFTKINQYDYGTHNGPCVVSAFNVSGGTLTRLLWQVNATWIQNCLCTAQGTDVGGGTTLQTSVFTFSCGNVAFGYNAYSGQLVWKHTFDAAQGVQSAGLAIQSTSDSAAPLVAIAQSDTSVVHFLSLATGRHVLNVTVSSFPTSLTSLSFLKTDGGFGLLGIGPGLFYIAFNQTSAKPTLIGNFSWSSANFCSSGTNVIPAVWNPRQFDLQFANPRLNIFSQGNLIYLGCAGVNTSMATVFALNTVAVQAGLASLLPLFNLTVTFGQYGGSASLNSVIALQHPTAPQQTVFLVSVSNVIFYTTLSGEVLATTPFNMIPSYSTFSSGLRVIESKSVVLVTSYSTLYGLSWPSLQPLWNNTQCPNDYQSGTFTLLPVAPFQQLDSDEFLVALNGIAVINVRTGSARLWSGVATNSEGVSLGFSVSQCDGFTTKSPQATDSNGTMCVTVLGGGSALVTMVTELWICMLPASRTIATAHVSGMAADVVPNATWNVASSSTPFAITAINTQGFTVTNVQGWTAPTRNPVAVYNRYLNGMPVAIVFTNVHVEIFNQQSSATLIGLFYFSDICLNRNTWQDYGNALLAQTAPDTIIFVDNACVYRLTVSAGATSAAMVAVALSSSLFYNSYAISWDQATLFVNDQSSVFAVDLASMTQRWGSDAPELGLYIENPQLILPPYGAPNNDPSSLPPLSSQQVILWGSDFVASFSASTGALLWYELYGYDMIFVATATSDGALIIGSRESLKKLSLVVTNETNYDRVIWENRNVTVEYEWGWDYSTPFIVQPPNANIVVVLTEFQDIVAVDITTGMLVWQGGNPVQDYYTITIVPQSFCLVDPTALVDAPCTIGVLISAQQETTYFISLTDGSLLYEVSGEMSNVVSDKGTMAMLNIQQSSMYFFEQGVNIMPAFYPTVQNGAVKQSVIASPPTVPSGFQYRLPALNSTSVPSAMGTGPQPFYLWEARVGQPEASYYASSSFQAALADGQQAIFTFGMNQTEESFIEVRSFVTGSLLTTIVLSNSTVASFPSYVWMYKLSDSLMLLLDNSTFWFVDYSKVLPNSPEISVVKTAPFVNAPNASQPFPPFPSMPFAESLFLPPTFVPDYSLFCLPFSNGLTMTCLDIAPSSSSFGSIRYTIGCPEDTALPVTLTGGFTYHSDLELWLFSCSSLPLTNITAVQAHSGALSWMTPIPYYDIQIAHFSYKNFGAFVYQEFYVTTVVVFSLATGAIIGTPFTFPSIPREINEFFVLEIAASPLDLNFIFLGVNVVTSFPSLNGSQPNPLWETPVDASYGVLYPWSPLTSRDIVYVSWPVSLVALDAFNGSVVFSVLDINTGIAITVVSEGYGVSISNGNYISYVDVSLPAPSMISLTFSSTVLYNCPYFAVHPTNNALLVGFADFNGEVVVGYANTTGTQVLPSSTVLIAHEDPQGRLYIYIPGYSTSMALYSGDTGDFLWGTVLGPNDEDGNAPLPQASFFDNTPFGPLLVQFFGTRYFVALSLANGSAVFDRLLPRCPTGMGSQYQNTGLVLTDNANNMLYSLLGTTCLYAIDIASKGRNISMITGKNFSEAALQQYNLLTATCIIVLDVFNQLTCVGRGAPGSSSTAGTILWVFQTGYDSGNNGVAPAILLKHYESLIFLSVGQTLYCVSEANGQLVWQLEGLGHHILMGFYSNDTLIVRSLSGVYRVTLDLTVPLSQRIVWFRSTFSILNASAPVPRSGQIEAPEPIVTTNQNVIAVIGLHIIALNLSSGNVNFVVQSSQECDAIVYQAFGVNDFFNNVFFITCRDIYLRSVVDGSVVGVLGSSYSTGGNLEGNRPLRLVPGNEQVMFINANGDIQIQPIPSQVIQLAPVAVNIAPNAQQPIALPPNFAPQTGFSPVATLPAGSPPLPNLNCVLNIEAMYSELVVCINTSLTSIFSNGTDPSALNCSAASAQLSPCVASWVANVLPQCTGAYIYLNNVLENLNATGGFSYCGHSEWCADAQAGAQEVCNVMNSASSFAGQQTFSPGFQLPAPANQLPQFSVPQVPTSSPSAAKGSGSKPLSGGAIVGIALGLITACVAGGLIFARIKRKDRRYQAGVDRSLRGSIMNPQDDSVSLQGDTTLAKVPTYSAV